MQGGALRKAVGEGRAETFTLTLGLAAPVGELEQWLRDAPPGDRAIYASGFDLPREAKAVKLVNRWQADGLVTLTSGRDPQDRRRTLWLVVKLAAGGDRPLSSPANPRAQAAGGGSASNRAQVAGGGSASKWWQGQDRRTRAEGTELLAHLGWLAERGRECPSNAALARELQLPSQSVRQRERSRQRVRYLLEVLERGSQIAIESHGRNAPRVITILARGRGCGKATAKPIEPGAGQ